MTGLWASQMRVGFWAGMVTSSVSKHTDWMRVHWELGAHSSGLNRPGREANHAGTSIAKIKNEWSCNCAILTPRVGTAVTGAGMRTAS